MFLPFVPIVLGSHMLITVASGPPSVDMQGMCRASANALYASDNTTNDFNTCVGDEQEAREQLVKAWKRFPARDRAYCVLPTEYLPSYIEWLTCLEMERDVKTIRREQPDGQPASMPPSSMPVRHSHKAKL